MSASSGQSKSANVWRRGTRPPARAAAKANAIIYLPRTTWQALRVARKLRACVRERERGELRVLHIYLY